MEVIIFALGVVLGALLTWFLNKNKHNLENNLKHELEEERQKVLNLSSQLAVEKDKNANSEETQKKLMMEFENIANKLFKENSKEFKENSMKDLYDMLKPFQELIVKSREEGIKDVVSLKEQIEMLSKNNQELSKEAQNLTSALKGDNKAQGNWGEVILERVLELSGLTKDVEYSTQEAYTSEEGKRRNPDVVINLPENKNVIIDSKVSLKSYEKLYNANDKEDIEIYQKEFLNSVKAHIKGLSEKSYQNLEGINSPDFVIMFIPIEASFSLIMKLDNELVNFAWERKIMLVSPSTLLMALKTINLFWVQEKQNRNVMQIVKESGSLYDKFVGFLDDLKGVSQSLSKTRETFDSAFNKLSEGKGNIIKRIENLKDLGAKATKQIPQEYLEEDLEEVEA